MLQEPRDGLVVGGGLAVAKEADVPRAAERTRRPGTRAQLHAP